jgi:hypothetical protein
LQKDAPVIPSDLPITKLEDHECVHMQFEKDDIYGMLDFVADSANNLGELAQLATTLVKSFRFFLN